MWNEAPRPGLGGHFCLLVKGRVFRARNWPFCDPVVPAPAYITAAQTAATAACKHGWSRFQTLGRTALQTESVWHFSAHFGM